MLFFYTTGRFSDEKYGSPEIILLFYLMSLSLLFNFLLLIKPATYYFSLKFLMKKGRVIMRPFQEQNEKSLISAEPRRRGNYRSA